ncbi:MAG: peptide chain release factor N(5)-glutamine methyltransferase [Gemmobacter sp.]|uniref:peptide chain release factor N(5)-glutamine methyltransferase n=1 Tax=Gemmobacter sp. TaxID=1898957 RepID=UPI001A3ECC5F|nr:peptide chain release factor N(5)-glutamine methyltransferase [Gemmobacter sp.]MBL8563460.1 peptide chain release factor N(5)-glutamine methyltransferase [Gemmobacter sp.]
MTGPNPITGQSLFRDGVARLAAAGLPDPARDVRLLLAHALGQPADRLMILLHDPVPTEAQSAFDALLVARIAGRPVSQILGRRQFWGRNFRVTADVLDPRPETEALVAEALAQPFTRLLDLGTGSGAIAVTLLAECRQATGLATDLSPEALTVARGNAATFGVETRLSFAQGSWFAAVPGQFDLIVSNPPYITATEMAELDPGVLEWEPHLALSPGGDGLDAYRAIAAGALAHLAPAGRLLVEIGPKQGTDVAALFTAAGLQALRILPDFDGRDRVVCAQAPG